MRTIESTNIASILANGKVADGGNAGQIHDLNLITPMSSMNVTPTEPEVNISTYFSILDYFFFFLFTKSNLIVVGIDECYNSEIDGK